MTPPAPHEAPHSARALPASFALVAILFVLSGACALVYEVVWSRLLVQVFGVTAFAVSTVLVAFMGGMAGGAAAFGRRAERVARPLRVFAWLEAGVGGYALVLPVLLVGVDAVYAAVHPSVADTFVLRSAVRFVLCLAVLLVPTALMGATLPALGQALLRTPEGVGRGVALLYFVNTIGAAAGCLAAGFGLIPALGLRGTTFVAVSINAAVAIAALILDRRASLHAEPVREMVEAEPPRDEESPTSTAWLHFMAFGSGMAALALEVVWFRVLVLVFGSTVYSFSAMLAVFLAGLALGSLLIGPVGDRWRAPVRLLVTCQAAAAIAVLLGYLAVDAMPGLFLRLLGFLGMDFAGMTWAKFLLSLLVLLPPALAFGATFPLVIRLAAARGGAVGGAIGRVYAWNTAGAIAGSFGAGFLLLPVVGSGTTMKLVALVALLLAFSGLLAETGPIRPRWALPCGLGLVVAAAIVVFAPGWDMRIVGSGAYRDPQHFFDASGRVILDQMLAERQLLSVVEGYNDTTIVHRSPNGKSLSVNGSVTASDRFEDQVGQKLVGHIPMALHAGPVRKVCAVGLGAGITAGAMGLYAPEKLTVIELEAGVLKGSAFFTTENHHVLEHPALDLHVDDGKNFLRMSRERYDVISSHPNIPALTGSGALYSEDYFRAGRDRLAPGGIMCQFAPVWHLPTADLRVILRTFSKVFPNVRIFAAGTSLVAVGSVDPFPLVDQQEIARRIAQPAVAADLANIGVRGPLELLSFLQLDEAAVRRFADDAPVNDDDHPRLEYSAPRAAFADTIGANLKALAALRPHADARARILGISESDRPSFTALAAATDATVDVQILAGDGRIDEALALAFRVADSGHRVAQYLAATLSGEAGVALLQSGDFEGARERFANALRFEPDRIDVLLGLGEVDLRLGKLEDADRPLSRAVELQPDRAGALYRLGLLREAQGRSSDAESLYRKAAEQAPYLSGPRVLLGRLLLGTGRPREALAALNEGIRLGETAPDVLRSRDEARLRATGAPQSDGAPTSW
jgi:spermidine synthase